MVEVIAGSLIYSAITTASPQKEGPLPDTGMPTHLPLRQVARLHALGPTEPSRLFFSENSPCHPAFPCLPTLTLLCVSTSSAPVSLLWHFWVP